MATFGAALRRAREQRGVSLDEIAAETRLSKRYILALEDEAISKLPGGTYNRAYLRSYASFLGLDPEALVRDYAREESHQTQRAEADELAAMTRAIEKRAASAADGPASRAREVLATPVGIAAVTIFALVVVGGIVWFGLSGFRRASGDLEVTVAESREPARAPARGSDSSPSATAAPSAADRSAPAMATAAQRASVPVTAPAPAPAPASAPAPAPAAGPSAATDPRVQLVQPAAPSKPATAAPPSSPVLPASRARAVVPETDRASKAPGATGAPSPDQANTDAVRAADASGSSRLTVAGSGVGTAVVERQLVGQADRFAVGSKVVFWTHVRGGRAGDTIDHVWFRDGTIVGAASLAVGSPDWRTQSRRLLDPSGVWVVEARDAEGHVLARHEFQAAP